MQNYLQATGEAIKDKLAYTIISDIKQYYPHLKRQAIDNSTIRQQALAHVRRKMMCDMTRAEKEAYLVVEEYQSISRKIGKILEKQQATEKEQRVAKRRRRLIELMNLSKKREELAYKIVNGGEQYQKALEYFRIGKANSLFGRSGKQQTIQRAQTKGEKLEQCAVRYEARERVQAYCKALYLDNLSERFRLAYEIRQNTKIHYATILGLGINSPDTWIRLRQDAKMFERCKFYGALSESEKAGFVIAEQYTKAKQSHAIAWKECFEYQKYLGETKVNAKLARLCQTLYGRTQ